MFVWDKRYHGPEKEGNKDVRLSLTTWGEE